MDRNKAISFMHDLLRMMVSKDGSDLFITTGSPPAMKVDGKMVNGLQAKPVAQPHPDAGAFDHERQAGFRVRGKPGM